MGRLSTTECTYLPTYLRDGGRGVLVFFFSVFTRRWRSGFLYLYSVLEGERHGVILLSSVRCLRR